MFGWAFLVQKSSTTKGQVGALCALCTGRLHNGRFFVRRSYTDPTVLDTVFALWVYRNLPVKFSCTHFTQGLLMQLSYRKLLV